MQPIPLIAGHTFVTHTPNDKGVVVVASITPTEDCVVITKAQHEALFSFRVTDEMVNRFLCWRLPASFNPDGGVAFDRAGKDPQTHWWPVGTNILNADEARQMLEHVLAKETSAQEPQSAVSGADEPHQTPAPNPTQDSTDAEELARRQGY